VHYGNPQSPAVGPVEVTSRDELRGLDLRASPAERRHARGCAADIADATLSLNRVSTVGNPAIMVGLVGAIGFGIWLAILRDASNPVPELPAAIRAAGQDFTTTAAA
jgi:hypothetical protein